MWTLVSKGVSKTIKYKAKEHKAGFIHMFWSILGASLLGNMFTGKEAIATRVDKGTIRAGETAVRAGQDFLSRLILQPILKFKNLIKMNLNLMVLFQKIIYLKKRMGSM